MLLCSLLSTSSFFCIFLLLRLAATLYRTTFTVGICVTGTICGSLSLPARFAWIGLRVDFTMKSKKLLILEIGVHCWNEATFGVLAVDSRLQVNWKAEPLWKNVVTSSLQTVTTKHFGCHCTVYVLLLNCRQNWSIRNPICNGSDWNHYRHSRSSSTH